MDPSASCTLTTPVETWYPWKKIARSEEILEKTRECEVQYRYGYYNQGKNCDFGSKEFDAAAVDRIRHMVFKSTVRL